ncbi:MULTISPECIES: OmpA family protein [Pseudomonas]|uniref:Outer membrane protein OmpA n=1 Tax=Pseudomonas delhiensis TaxID=366289 RepID=A0A239N9U7_9PSED|nr:MULTISPECIES: OmpA family protein [Pseudomonas]MED5611106.1 OmpA family protein [Pseudomonas sp. JH-2]PWU26487.1 OmpA family protein [Pseudomonas sp. RW407]SDL15770.1 Outer membrane protein OmpA [Pseudomonas delhiensis]SNT50988.1 Outer membrane protein OmpA [Pseudomonas delhiensis]
MSIKRTALPLLLVSTLLTGCAGLQKSDWPTCALVGGVGGAGLGSIESSAWAGWGALIGGVLGASYCWVHGEGEKVVEAPPPAPAPEPAPLPKEETIVVRDLHFAFDSSKIDNRDKDKLDTIATRLKGEASTTTLDISGHTDSVGTDAYNQKLSERRAHAVADYLVDAGVSASSIKSVEGYGESKPVADNKTKEGRAENRRVEILIKRQ